MPLSQALVSQVPAPLSPTQAVVADLIARSSASGPERMALARQVLEGQVAGEGGLGAGLHRIASYTRAAPAQQLALQAVPDAIPMGVRAAGPLALGSAEQLALGPAQQLALQAGPRVFPMGAASSAGALGAEAAVGGSSAAYNIGSQLAGTLASRPALGAAAGSIAGEATAAAATTSKLRSALGMMSPTLTRSALTRGGLYAAGGYLAGQLENRVVGEHNNSSWDEAATGALTGAGIGAGIGSIVPGIGTGIGAGVGAAAGGLIGYFGPKDSGYTPTNQELTRQLTQVNKLATTAGLDQDARTQLALQLQAGRETVGSKTAMKALGAQVQAQVPQLAAQAQADKREQSRSLAIQAAMAPLMQKYLDRTASSARESQAVLNDAASTLPAGMAELYRSRGATMVSDADAMNAALAAQALQAPNQQAQALQDQINAQVRQQAIAQLTSQLSGAGGSGGSLQQLLAS